MKLYGRYMSPFVRRVGVTLQALDMPYEHVEVAPFDEWDRAMSINPVVRIPALELDDGDLLIESSAILDYLDEAAGAKALAPRSGKRRRDVLKLVSIGVGAMEKAVGAAYEVRFHEKEQVGKAWLERCETQTVSALAALDGAAKNAGANGWLYGDSMTQADVSAVVAYTFAAMARPKLGVADKTPNLSKFAARLEAMPAFANTKP